MASTELRYPINITGVTESVWRTRPPSPVLCQGHAICQARCWLPELPDPLLPGQKRIPTPKIRAACDQAVHGWHGKSRPGSPAVTNVTSLFCPATQGVELLGDLPAPDDGLFSTLQRNSIYTGDG